LHHEHGPVQVLLTKAMHWDNEQYIVYTLPIMRGVVCGHSPGTK